MNTSTCNRADADNSTYNYYTAFVQNPRTETQLDRESVYVHVWHVLHDKCDEPRAMHARTLTWPASKKPGAQTGKGGTIRSRLCDTRTFGPAEKSKTRVFAGEWLCERDNVFNVPKAEEKQRIAFASSGGNKWKERIRIAIVQCT